MGLQLFPTLISKQVLAISILNFMDFMWIPLKVIVYGIQHVEEEQMMDLSLPVRLLRRKKTVINPPQVCSITIDYDTGLIKRYTIGYVVDRNVGNTGGLGGLYGILYAIGRPLPFPEANPWKPSLSYRAFQSVGKLISAVT